MLKKINRLAGLKTRVKSQRFDTPLFNVKIFSGRNEKTKFGFVVSKKIDKRAVVRNKTKRALGKAAGQCLEKIKDGQNIIVYAKTKIDFSQEKMIAKELEQVLKKAEILR